MIRLGKHVTQPGDQLYDVPIEKIHQALINPDGEVAGLLRRLLAIRAMDPAQYRRMKTTLPYIVCAQFHPKVRRKENFLFADRFLIDLDHIAEHGHDLQELRDRFANDERVELMFTSPSGDGLKVLFKLEPKITDAAYYVVFYKAFCLYLERNYKLGAVLDHKTHDVSRCCFVSYDPDAYLNTRAKAIDPESIVKRDSFFEMDRVEKEASELAKTHQQEALPVARPEKTDSGQDLPQDILDFIKVKTGQRLRKKEPRQHEQPEQLEEIVANLRAYLDEIQAEIESMRPISYGRQVRVRSGSAWAEINVFFGKRGVSIVPTTKTGSHREFGKTVADYLKASFESP